MAALVGRSKGLLTVAVVAAAVVAAAVYLIFDPAGSVFFPKCPFLMLTGLECPGCGTQRALHSLLHLHVADAVRYNALLVLAVPFMGVLLAALILKSRFPGFYAKVNSATAAWTVFAVVVAWWIIRNIAGI